MDPSAPDDVRQAESRVAYVTCVEGPRDAAAARLLVESLRRFGGGVGGGPLLLFARGAAEDFAPDLAGPLVQVVPLRVPPPLLTLPFGGAVVACAEAEERTSAATLVWVDPRVLFCRPPLLFDLGEAADVAARPVHISNVGSARSAPPDAYWRRIYDAVGLSDTDLVVESFVDRRRVRAYFNSHAVAVRPGKALFRGRRELVSRLADDEAFLAGPCGDPPHRLFLFQAAFSALVAAAVDPARVRVLPSSYAYPYNLHADVPAERRAPVLDDLVCFAWEGRSLSPKLIEDVAIREPMRSWLAARVPSTG